MKYQTIDMTAHPRHAHFDYFSAMPDPYVGVTVEVEISCFLDTCRQAKLRHAEAKAQANLDDGEDGVSLLFVSSVPWLHYTALRQPVPTPADSNPRITWGQYRTEQGRTHIPVTLLANHALVDGVHIQAFYTVLQGELERFAQETGNH